MICANCPMRRANKVLWNGKFICAKCFDKIAAAVAALDVREAGKVEVRR